jgi:KUP system potassium uptake protein
VRVPGTEVFLNENPDRPPILLVRSLESPRVLSEEVIPLTPDIADVPKVPRNQRIETEDLGDGIVRLIVHFGFMGHRVLVHGSQRCQPGAALRRPVRQGLRGERTRAPVDLSSSRRCDVTR